MVSDDQMLTSLRHVRELESFLHDLLDGLASEEKPRHGEDVVSYAEKRGLQVPEFLSGTEITWDADTRFEAELGDRDALVLVRPGRPEVLGLTIGCVRIGRVKVCLECGWLWCRVVIKGTF